MAADRAAVFAMVLGTVNNFLRMLNTYTQGKRLGLYQYILTMQHPENIVRRVAGCQYYSIGQKLFAIASCTPFILPNSTSMAVNFGIKQNFAACFQNAFAHGGDYLRQFVGTNMRAGIYQNIFGSAMGHKGF
jgi:hypothetical protein